MFVSVANISERGIYKRGERELERKGERLSQEKRKKERGRERL